MDVHSLHVAGVLVNFSVTKNDETSKTEKAK